MKRLILLFGFVAAAHGEPIDLATTLRLAGAKNLDVQIAREKVVEAQANRETAVAQFFPWISPGVGYRKHEGRTQDVEGRILDASKQSYSAGATVTAQVDIGNALYKSLEARQLVKASEHGLDAQRAEAIFTAVQGYFDLAKAQAVVGVAREAVRISEDYQKQIHNAVEAGIAFKGDELRVRVQSERNQLLLRQAEEQQRLAAARLAQYLHLDPKVELAAMDAELAPLSLTKPDAPLDPLVAQALSARPELRQSQSLVAAARQAKNGAVFGPLIPTIGAQAFWGGFGGGVGGEGGSFGDSQDYMATLSWRIGPGGMFDSSRSRAANSRQRSAQLIGEKVHDQIVREVVDAVTRVRSLADQLKTVRRSLDLADESLRLSRQRKEFGVGIVLEAIQAEQDFTRARNDYLTCVAEFNKSQYSLHKAIGATDAGSPR